MSDKSDVLWNPGEGEDDGGLYSVEMVEGWEREWGSDQDTYCQR